MPGSYSTFLQWWAFFLFLAPLVRHNIFVKLTCNWHCKRTPPLLCTINYHPFQAVTQSPSTSHANKSISVLFRDAVSWDARINNPAPPDTIPLFVNNYTANNGCVAYMTPSWLSTNANRDAPVHNHSSPTTSSTVCKRQANRLLAQYQYPDNLMLQWILWKICWCNFFSLLILCAKWSCLTFPERGLLVVMCSGTSANPRELIFWIRLFL